MTRQPATRGRPRDTGVDRRILEAATALLREHGPAAVHIDAVAERSGVARTTIYRRHRDRRSLVTATLHHVTDQGVPPSGGSLHDKVSWLLSRVRDVLESGLGRGGVGAVLTDADPDFTEALQQTLSRQLQPLLRAMAADAAAGVLRHDVDSDAVVTLAFGAYLGELLRHGEAGPDWLPRTQELLVRALSPE